MGVINVLDKHVAELIAAGEVVERPSSVIKELVENSIDAGAKHISVEIKNGGTTFIRVTDDGCGILKEDVKKAFLRHATSKVHRENDLNSIATLGFRGEALASISAVSRLELITRNKQEEAGTSYEIHGGEEISFSDAGCPVGTTFIVRDLFYNVPARMKFLKKDVSEGNAVSAVMDKSALSHPEVAFTYIKDGKQMLKTSGDGKLKSAIYSVYGREFAANLLPVDYELNGVKVQGYVSRPVSARPNRNMQNFFINGRYVKTRTASVALEEAFKGSIMVGKFPSCVLHISLSFEAIDVNVHPAKVEVRFINERPVFDAVYHGVKSALMSLDKAKDAVFKNRTAFDDIPKPNPFHMAQSVLKDAVRPAPVRPSSVLPVQKTTQDPFAELDLISVPKESIKEETVLPKTTKESDAPVQKIENQNLDPFDLYTETAVQNSKKNHSFAPASPKKNTVLSHTENIIEKNEDIPQKEIKPLIEPEKVNLRYIGEAFKTYIIVEKNEKEILFIDKHAAHERMIYEKLKKERGKGFSQLLLEPLPVTLSKEEYNAAVNHIDLFREACFDIEDFGNGVVLVRSAPQYLESGDITESVMEMADHISRNKRDINSEKMDWIYHNVACRAAIKAGNVSTPGELMDIVKTLEADPTLRYCPHGRPVCIVMSKYEIEKQFGRV